MMCLHINQKAHMAHDLSFIVKSKRILKGTGNDVHRKTGTVPYYLRKGGR